jgi:hypothetical protein
LCEPPDERLDAVSPFLVVEVEPKLGHPLIATEPKGWNLLRQAARQGRLPGTRKTADEN